MITNQKELKSFLEICRKQGVTEIKLEGFHVKFGDMPSKESQSQPQLSANELTDEQLMFYSVDGVLNENPQGR